MQLVQQRFARKTSEMDASIGGGRETRSGSRVQFFSIHPFSPSLSMIFFFFFFVFLQYRALLLQDATSDEL